LLHPFEMELSVTPLGLCLDDRFPPGLEVRFSLRKGEFRLALVKEEQPLPFSYFIAEINQNLVDRPRSFVTHCDFFPPHERAHHFHGPPDLTCGNRRGRNCHHPVNDRPWFGSCGVRLRSLSP